MAQLTATGCGLCWPHLGQNQPFELGRSPEQALQALRNDVHPRHLSFFSKYFLSVAHLHLRVSSRSVTTYKAGCSNTSIVHSGLIYLCT